MKRNYFIAIAVAALMVAATVAQAADISFSGQFRPRWMSQNDADETTNSRDHYDTRVRLNAKATVNPNTSVFLQFQSVGNWGTSAAAAGSSGTRLSATVSDTHNDVGLHQAFMTYKNIFGHAIDAKIGRQEVVLDGHRLFGHTGWTTGAQTNDAIRLNHASGNHELNYIYIAAIETGNEGNSNDVNAEYHVFRAATQGILGGALQGYFVISDDDSAANDASDENTFYTIGARHTGKGLGLNYRVEYYHQFGDGGVPAASADLAEAYATTPVNATAGNIDMDAQMFGIRVGKTFKNVKFSPTITLWYDNLSGTDDDDVNGDDYGTFHTLQDTGHKFYGFVDNFLTANGDQTQRYGLEDFAIKTKWKLSAANTFKADFHHFETQTDMSDNDSDTIRANATTTGAFQTTSAGSGDGLGNDLGQEIDLVLIHKYDANTKILVGYSHYFTTLTHSYLGGSGQADSTRDENDGQDFMWVMVDTKF